MSTIVVYHAGCPDGAMSAATASLSLPPGTVFIPATYKRPMLELITLEQARDAYIFILDFSFFPKDLELLASIAKRVTILDHHDSTIKRFTGWTAPMNIEFTLNKTMCGAMLTWKHFKPTWIVPKLLDCIDDYDRWQHRFPESRAIHALLRSYVMDIETFAKMVQQPFDNRWVTEGEIILRANQQQARIIAGKSEEVRFAGIAGLAVNSPVHQDDIGEMLAKQGDIGIVWYYRNRNYKVSMRSIKNNVYKIAEMYGGSGHEHSASFTCNDLPWNLPYETEAELASIRESIERHEF